MQLGISVVLGVRACVTRRIAARVGVGLALGLAAPATVSANWNEPVPGAVAVNATWPNIAAVGGVPYFAWSDGTPFQARVKRLVGGTWTPVGGVLNVDPSRNGEIPTLADVDGVPYVVWSEDAGTAQHIYVKRFVGGAWTQVGSELDIAGHTGAFAPSIASVGGVPYVAWRQIDTGVSKLYVKRFNGTAWVEPAVGALNIVAAKDATFPRIADAGGVPTVAWLEKSGPSNVEQLRVKQFNGAAWVQPAAGALNTDPTAPANEPSLTAVGAVPYIAWVEPASGANHNVYVKRFAGGAWTLVGDPVNIGPAGLEPTIANVNGTPFVTWRESSSSPASEQVHVKQFIGGAWATVGGVLNVDPTKFAFSPTITSIGGVPYVAWNEQTDATNYGVRVRRLEPDIVSQSATPSLTGATLSAQLNDFGVPLPAGFEFGPTPVFGTQFGLQRTPGTGISTLTQAVGGLASGTRYFYRAFGSDTVRQTSLGATQVFSTLPLRPVITRLAQSAVLWRQGNLLPKASARRRRRPPVGTTFSFRLNEAAQVRFDFTQRVAGRRVSRKCVAPTRRNRRKPRCTRTVTRGTLTFRGHAGLNKLRFQGRISRSRRLRPGRYTLIATATAQGLRSTARSLSFTILRR